MLSRWDEWQTLSRVIHSATNQSWESEGTHMWKRADIAFPLSVLRCLVMQPEQQLKISGWLTSFVLEEVQYVLEFNLDSSCHIVAERWFVRISRLGEKN